MRGGDGRGAGQDEQGLNSDTVMTVALAESPVLCSQMVPQRVSEFGY